MTVRSDRRIQMTKKMLEEELVRASAFGDPEDISIRQICDGAGVSRVTFYKYYDSVHDLLNETAANALARIINPDVCRSLEDMEEAVRHILLNRSLYTLLIDKGYLEKYLCDGLIKAVNDTDMDARSKEVALAETQYTAGGLSGFLRWHLKTQPDIPVRKTAELILRFYETWHRDILEMRNL